MGVCNGGIDSLADELDLLENENEDANMTFLIQEEQQEESDSLGDSESRARV